MRDWAIRSKRGEAGEGPKPDAHGTRQPRSRALGRGSRPPADAQHYSDSTPSPTFWEADSHMTFLKEVKRT